MSAPAETVAAAPVEDVKPAETPAAEPAAPAVEEPKTEEAAPATTEAPKEEPAAEASNHRSMTRFTRLTLSSFTGACRCCTHY